MIVLSPEMETNQTEIDRPADMKLFGASAMINPEEHIWKPEANRFGRMDGWLLNGYA